MDAEKQAKMLELEAEEQEKMLKIEAANTKTGGRYETRIRKGSDQARAGLDKIAPDRPGPDEPFPTKPGPR